MRRMSFAAGALAAGLLGAGLLGADIGHNGGPPIAVPRYVSIKPPRPKDKRDKKRKKPLRVQLRGKISRRNMREDGSYKACLLRMRRDREIGVHPKYLSSYRKGSASEWEAIAAEWDKRHGLR